MDNLHVLIDPFILALPGTARARAGYVYVLLSWLRILLRNRDRCSISEASLARLWSSGRYPTRMSLERLFSELGIREVSVIDVVNLLRPVSETEPFLEQHIGLRSILAADVMIAPEPLLTRLEGELSSAFGEAITMAMYAHAGGWAPDGLIVATVDMLHGEGQVQAHVTIVEKLSGDFEEVDLRLDEVFGFISEPASVESDVSIVDVYGEPHRAVVLAHGELDTSLIHVGEDFVSSLEGLSLQRQPAVLRAVYRRVALAALGELHNLEGANLHPVREDASADAAQVTRGDSAKLWRCMVTKRGAGYRLHYWTLSDGGIEIDRVMGEGNI